MKATVTTGLVILAIALASVGGYIANIVELAHGGFSASMTILKFAGILVPFVGAVLGWID
jgi:hypothetical protein